MNPPPEYFRRCNADTPGAQRVGFDWFAFTDVDAHARMLGDGAFEKVEPEPCSEREDKDDEISTLEDDLAEAEKRIEKLERELEEARK